MLQIYRLLFGKHKMGFNMNVYNFIADNIKSKIQEIDEFKGVLTPEVINSVAVEVPKIRDFGGRFSRVRPSCTS